MTSSLHAFPLGSVVVTGATGQLGGELVRLLGSSAVPLSRTDLDLRDPLAIRDTISRLRPAAVISCAAWTAVDAAEQDPDGCFAINATAVGHLAEACAATGSRFVQVSTDYVFGRDEQRTRPYLEDDAPAPLSVYGASKLAGEQASRGCPRHLVVRTCGLYSAAANGPVRGRNFLDTMLSLAATRRDVRVVADQICTPSYVPHVALGILQLLAVHAEGTFHLTNAGETSWFGLASELFRQAGLPMEVVAIASHEYPSPVARPQYSVLDTGRFTAITGTRLPAWTEGVRDYLQASGRLAPATVATPRGDSRPKLERTACSPSS
jgi:dTDP-4-dehydrorhamnose reductase